MSPSSQPGLTNEDKDKNKDKANLSFFRTPSSARDAQSEKAEEAVNSGSWAATQSKPRGCCSRFLKCLGSVLMLEVLPKVSSGYRSPLKESSVPRIPEYATSSVLIERAEREWAEQVKRGPKKASVFMVIWKLHGFALIASVLCGVCQGVVSTVYKPLMLKMLIEAVADPAVSNDTVFVMAVALSFGILLEGVLQAHAKQLGTGYVGSRFVTWAMTLVHRKSMRVSDAAVQQSGLVASNIIGNDIIRLFEEWKWMVLLPYVVTSLIGGVCVLAYTLGVASVFGFIVMFGIVAANFYLTEVLKKIKAKDFKCGDTRVSLMKEVLDGIKAIKMMAWEYPFQGDLNKARDTEAKYVRKYRLFQVSSINLGRSSPSLSAAFAILAVVYLNREAVTSANLFVVLSSFLGLRLPLIGIPSQSAILGNTIVSFRRIKRFLLLDDAQATELIADESPNLLEMNDATFRWNVAAEAVATKKKKVKNDVVEPEEAEEGFSLCGVNIVVPKGKMIAVIGRIGSGKSSLINAAIGGMNHIMGEFRTTDAVGYVPQKAFVISGTIQENIIMDKPYDADLFDRVVKAAALKVDLSLFPKGKATEIGERGQTLSGGQKQRVCIARALYAEPKLLVLVRATSFYLGYRGVKCMFIEG